ncbi:hypothetical protein [Marispirochaeta aestuarii]|uniref:hypothetical protein n=1 Tax=Marispirochaeta aestuarii TaxID=1963862 RepID=UPI002ABE4C75|nr:hypothetical protein [Marispirochaeta aestuarii]
MIEFFTLLLMIYQRFNAHCHTWVAWIQAYIDDFFKGKAIDDFPCKEAMYYEIEENTLFIVDRRNSLAILTFGTKKPAVRRVIAIGAFEYCLGVI